jgi:hypothetical protein
MEKECLICGNLVYDMDEVDIGVGVITSNEPPICEQCYEEKPDEVAEILEQSKKRIFGF